MKKNGFTLAEVLITLAIIGVVATMTLPALISNTNEQQARTGFKKAINTLTEAGQMNMAVDNWAYDNVVALAGAPAANSVDTQSLYAILAKRLNVDFQTTTGFGTGPVPVPAPLAAIGVDTYFYLRDGSAIYFPRGTVGATTGTLQADGLPLGYDIIYDTNGSKGPNILSNCLGTVAGARDSVANSAADAAQSDCNDKAKRVIKDQFLIRLRGAQAVPSGAASKWAFAN